MSDLNKLKELAKNADSQVTWVLLPNDMAKDGWETDVINYIAAISPDALTNLIARLEAAEAQLAALAAQEPVAWCPKTQIDLLAKHRMVEADLCSEKRFDEIPLYTRAAPPAVNLAELVPDGWKLVPIEPTRQMLEASYREASVYSRTAYQAMLAAAPQSK